MRALLDTHAFLWWIADSGRLSTTAYRAIENEGNELFISAASAWEITTKYRLGKLPKAESAAFDVAGIIAGQGFEESAWPMRNGRGNCPAPIGTRLTECWPLKR